MRDSLFVRRIRQPKYVLLAGAVIFILLVNALILLRVYHNTSGYKESLVLAPTDFSWNQYSSRSFGRLLWLSIGNLDSRYKCADCAYFTNLPQKQLQAIYDRACTIKAETKRKINKTTHLWVLLENNGVAFKDYTARYLTEKDEASETSESKYRDKREASRLFAIFASVDRADLVAERDQRLSNPSNIAASYFIAKAEARFNPTLCQSIDDFAQKKSERQPEIHVKIPAFESIYWQGRPLAEDETVTLYMGKNDFIYLK